MKTNISTVIKLVFAILLSISLLSSCTTQRNGCSATRGMVGY